MNLINIVSKKEAIFRFATLALQPSFNSSVSDPDGSMTCFLACTCFGFFGLSADKDIIIYLCLELVTSYVPQITW